MRSERLKKKLSKKAGEFLGRREAFEEGRCWVYVPGFEGEGDYIEAWEYLVSIFNTTFNLAEDPDSEFGFDWVDEKHEIKATPARVFSWARRGLPPKNIMDQLGAL